MSSGYVDEDNGTVIDAVLIQDIMEERGLSPYKIKPRFRYQTVHGKGSCHCACGNSWSSYKSSITIDLFKQEVSKYWKQKCLNCKNACEMDFAEDKMEDMVHHVIDRYFKLLDGTWQSKKKANAAMAGGMADGMAGGMAGGLAYESPHESALCERCGYGRRKCWLKSKQQKQKSFGGLFEDKADEGEYLYDDYAVSEHSGDVSESFQELFKERYENHDSDDDDEAFENEHLNEDNGLYIYDDF